MADALPTVKCSSCGQLVPLAELGGHACSPNISQKSSTSQKPAPALLSLHRTDAHREWPPREGEPVLAPSRDPSSNVPFPKCPSPLDRDRPQLPGAFTPPPPPDRDAIPPALQRVRFPSNATRIAPLSPARAAFPLPFAEPASHPVPGRLTPLRTDDHLPHQSLAPPRSPFADRTPSNPSSPSAILPAPSFERARTSPTPRLTIDKSRPSLDMRRPFYDQNPPSTAPLLRPYKIAVPAPSLGSVPFPSSAPPVLPPPLSVRQPPPPLAYDREIDTKIGGEAGMAGVGRRGFAAAARAAMIAASRPPSHQPLHLGNPHRANTPQYLDNNHVIRATVTPPLSPNSVQTPSPVSPFPASPVSPANGTQTQYANLPSPHDATRQPSPAPTSNDKIHPLPSGVRIASPSRSPSPIPNPFERRLSGETVTQSPLPGVTMPLPFFDILKPELDPGNESDDESVYTTHSDLKTDENTPSSPSADSDVGLAYARDSDEDTPVVMPLDIRKSAVKEGMNKVKFPTSVLSDRRHPPGPSRQTSATSLRSTVSSRSVATSFTNTARTRSASAATQSTARSVGALERAMETLIEEGASVSVLASGSVLASIGGSAPGRGVGKPSRSNTVPGPASPEQKPPKLPARSHTSPSHPHIHSERGLTGEVVRIRNRGSAKRKVRLCAGCDSRIEDGRWIQMDGGSVLCERCWKNMYLPKCRRCNFPIEKQAVSSRDGQLKGKYHKECFNCHTCQKPFPDKEFYVFDGKPFCAYHYHEANNSLCGASSCGQPIEGPCAVTHSLKRYHPEHLLCEFEDGCQERLEEYWEVDGQMLCERHAAFIGSRDSGWTRGNDGAGDTQEKSVQGRDEGRMMKRMTRFIDLAAGGDDELDIR